MKIGHKSVLAEETTDWWFDKLEFVGKTGHAVIRCDGLYHWVKDDQGRNPWKSHECGCEFKRH